MQVFRLDFLPETAVHCPGKAVLQTVPEPYRRQPAAFLREPELRSPLTA